MRRRQLGSLSHLGCIGFVALLCVGSARITDNRDPRYWADRMEQALLPQSSLRANVVFKNQGGLDPVPELRARLTRVQGPSNIRSVVAVGSPPRERRVLKITSTSDGGVERELYAGAGHPMTIRVDRYDHILRTAFTYEDLGFVEMRHFSDADVEFEDLPEGRVVRLTAKPYGPYGKVVARLDPETALPTRVEFFDTSGILRRTVTYSQVDREGHDPFPLRVEASEPGSGGRSTLQFKAVELGVEIGEYEFGEPYLRGVLRELEARPF